MVQATLLFPDGGLVSNAYLTVPYGLNDILVHSWPPKISVQNLGSPLPVYMTSKKGCTRT